MATPSLLLIPDRYKASKLYSQIPDSGAGDLAFTRALDTATRVNSAGLIEKVRTNIALYSEEFNQPNYTKVNSTISTNAGVAPDGTTTADKLIMDNAQSPTSADNAGWRQNAAITSGIYAFSFFAKAAEFSSVNIRENFNTGAFLNINLTNGAVTNPAPGEFIGATATNVGNGWYRIAWGAPSGTNNIQKYNIRAGVTGDGTSGFLNWGFQVETGDIATDYIPTTTAAVSVGPVADIPRIDYTGGGCGKLLLEPQRTNLILFSEQLNNAAWVKVSGGTGSNPVVTANSAISPDGFQNADSIFFDAGAGTSASDQSQIYQEFSVSAGVFTGSFYAKTASGTAQILYRIDGSSYEKLTITNQWQRFVITKTLSAGTNFFEINLRRGIDEPLNASATIQIWGCQVE